MIIYIVVVTIYIYDELTKPSSVGWLPVVGYCPKALSSADRVDHRISFNLGSARLLKEEGFD